MLQSHPDINALGFFAGAFGFRELREAARYIEQRRFSIPFWIADRLDEQLVGT